MSKQVDLCGELNQEWWEDAAYAQKWKAKWECMKQIFCILTGKEDPEIIISDLNCSIQDHEKSQKLMKILTDWLMNVNHVFTRMAILKVMPKLIEGFKQKTIVKFQDELIETIMTKQWREKKQGLLVLTTPTLIALWVKVCIVPKY